MLRLHQILAPQSWLSGSSFLFFFFFTLHFISKVSFHEFGMKWNLCLFLHFSFFFTSCRFGQLLCLLVNNLFLFLKAIQNKSICISCASSVPVHPTLTVDLFISNISTFQELIAAALFACSDRRCNVDFTLADEITLVWMLQAQFSRWRCWSW